MVSESMIEEPIIKRRDITYPRIEMRTGHLELILPRDVDEKVILEKYGSWIASRKQQIAEMVSRAQDLLLQSRTKEEYLFLIRKLATKKLGSEPRIQLRTMKSKWASCSPSGTITINTLGKDLPEHYLDYIISHELLHLTNRKHDVAFTTTLRAAFPDMEKIEKDLAGYWFKVMGML